MIVDEKHTLKTLFLFFQIFFSKRENNLGGKNIFTYFWVISLHDEIQTEETKLTQSLVYSNLLFR